VVVKTAGPLLIVNLRHVFVGHGHKLHKASEPKLSQDNSLISVERPLESAPADHTTLDLAARGLVNEVAAEKAAEVAIQSRLEVVLVN
jgi:hypothetical protein